MMVRLTLVPQKHTGPYAVVQTPVSARWHPMRTALCLVICDGSDSSWAIIFAGAIHVSCAGRLFFYSMTHGI